MKRGAGLGSDIGSVRASARWKREDLAYIVSVSIAFGQMLAIQPAICDRPDNGSVIELGMANRAWFNQRRDQHSRDAPPKLEIETAASGLAAWDLDPSGGSGQWRRGHVIIGAAMLVKNYDQQTAVPIGAFAQRVIDCGMSSSP